QRDIHATGGSGKVMNLLRIHASPNRITTWTLSWFLFVSGIAAYFYVAHLRHQENADDRVMPTATQMIRAFQDAALRPAEEDNTEEFSSAPLFSRIRGNMLWKDTTATGRRFLISVLLLFPAVLLGLHMAMFPYIGAFFLRFIQFFDKIVALSLLP